MKRLIFIIAILVFISCKKSKDGCWHCWGSNGSQKTICTDTIGSSFDEITTSGIVHYECSK